MRSIYTIRNEKVHKMAREYNIDRFTEWHRGDTEIHREKALFPDYSD